MTESIEPAYLRERLRYDPETGRLYWRECADRRQNWNSRYAGTEAFGSAHNGGYRTGSIDGTQLLAHRVVWAMLHDEWPVEIDHEDHDRSNNRSNNLRATGRVGNACNQSRRSDHTSGAVGVYWHKPQSKWHAQIRVKQRNISLGLFEDINDAAAARKVAEAKYGFHPNHGACV